MIVKEQLEEIKKEILESLRPLVFFDDDPDGLCSYLQLFHNRRNVKGVILKSASYLNRDYHKKINEYGPDKVFILDIAKVDQDFFDMGVKFVWIDHHKVLDMKNVTYYNPMIQSEGKDNRPVSYWMHKTLGTHLWIAMVGSVSDWFLPLDLKDEFISKYPDLLSEDVTKPEEALFNTKLGTLARMFSFAIKGYVQESNKYVRICEKIKDPYELLKQTTPAGRAIYKKYEKVNREYQKLKSSVKITDDPLILFEYSTESLPLTQDLSNELLYENEDKFILIARDDGNLIKCSLRGKRYKIRDILEKSLKGITGKGGGHLYACGAVIEKKDFKLFVENIRSFL